MRHDENNDRYIAFFRGPLTLAVDSGTGKPADAVFDLDAAGEITGVCEPAPGEDCLLKMRITERGGDAVYLVDYASAGKDWQTEIAAWLKTK